ncbi:FmdB family zinc ribbon protein [Halomonas halmophila]|uniref:FmdB family transcriptional regulator n=1 Tax=Halomonas halmophila TaxID=252 RepID=A0A4Y4F1C4_9GAMM|nr:zinc ribbon domain-containing protein [Halomonas halmophila]GED22445.1 FmdB family transcriptional regulator [Halomonas halmophila]
MPIYEYACKACGHRLEKLQRLSAEPLTDCPACSQPALDRLVSAAGFRLAGGGWYETDFKTGSKKNLAGSSEGAKAPEISGKDGTAA